MALTLGRTIELQHDGGLVRQQRGRDPALQARQAQGDDRLAQLGRAGDVAVPRVVAHGELTSFAHRRRRWASSALASATTNIAVKTMLTAILDRLADKTEGSVVGARRLLTVVIRPTRCFSLAGRVDWQASLPVDQ